MTVFVEFVDMEKEKCTFFCWYTGHFLEARNSNSKNIPSSFILYMYICILYVWYIHMYGRLWRVFSGTTTGSIVCTTLLSPFCCWLQVDTWTQNLENEIFRFFPRPAGSFSFYPSIDVLKARASDLTQSIWGLLNICCREFRKCLGLELFGRRWGGTSQWMCFLHPLILTGSAILWTTCVDIHHHETCVLLALYLVIFHLYVRVDCAPEIHRCWF